MRRIILLTIALLGTSHLMRSDADTDDAPPATKSRKATSDGSCCETGQLSRAALMAGGVSNAEACDLGDEAACCLEENGTFPETEKAIVPPASTRGVAFVVSDLMAVPERAEADAYAKLRQAVSAWLVPDARAGWTAPDSLVDSLVVETRLREIPRDYAAVHQATLKVDLSPEHRNAFLNTYRQQEGRERMGWLGAVGAFVLVILALLAGYIRTDEVTRGYYTNRLRLAAAAGAGAAGFALYRMLA